MSEAKKGTSDRMCRAAPNFTRHRAFFVPVCSSAGLEIGALIVCLKHEHILTVGSGLKWCKSLEMPRLCRLG
jgi:hypothetical protein